MKTTVYYGQPNSRSCLSFDKVDDTLKWLAERQKAREIQGATEEALDPAPDVPKTLPNSVPTAAPAQVAPKLKTWMAKRCPSQAVGRDGTRRCSPHFPPYRFGICLPARLSVTGKDIDEMACNNHIDDFLAKGWILMSKSCANCITNEALKDLDVCENCIDLVGVPVEAPKASGGHVDSTETLNLCLNRFTTHGCLVFTEKEGVYYCAFCRSRGWTSKDAAETAGHMDNRTEIPAVPAAVPAVIKLSNTRIRTIPHSDRPCRITVGCAGSMVANVQRVSDGLRPELWWTCPTCRARKVATRSQAIVDPHVQPVLMEATEMDRIYAQLDALPPERPTTDTDAEQESVSAEKTDMSLQIRHIMAE